MGIISPVVGGMALGLIISLGVSYLISVIQD